MAGLDRQKFSHPNIRDDASKTLKRLRYWLPWSRTLGLAAKVDVPVQHIQTPPCDGALAILGPRSKGRRETIGRGKLIAGNIKFEITVHAVLSVVHVQSCCALLQQYYLVSPG